MKKSVLVIASLGAVTGVFVGSFLKACKEAEITPTEALKNAKERVTKAFFEKSATISIAIIDKTC